jgi:ethanolamine ammonia-lyase large subunit
MFSATIGARRYAFPDLVTLLAKASPHRSGDALAGIAAETGEERVAAQFALADLPLRTFLDQHVVPYENDEVTRLIIDSHDKTAFAPIAQLTVGSFRDWLLSDAATQKTLAALARGVTPEMAAAVSKISSLQDLMVIAAKCRVVTGFRNTLGLPGRLSVRLQPNHPTDDVRGIAASILDGLLLGAGDAVIGVNPATDSPERAHALLCMLEDVRIKLAIPTQSCVLAHVTTMLALIEGGSPVDIVFQSIAGTQDANRSFGINLGLLAQCHVFRDRPGKRALRQRPSRGRSADTRGARLCGRTPIQSAARQYGGRLHRSGIFVRRQTDHARGARGSFLRKIVGAADGLRRLLHQSRGG